MTTKKIKETKCSHISNRKWESRRLVDIFDNLTRGKRLKKSDHIEGNIPYVSSTAFNNGNDGTCGNKKKVRIFSNCLTVANSGSVGSCFYHPYAFVASDHVTKLEKKGLSPFCYLSLSVLVEQLKEKYEFNREINGDRITHERILIPLDDNNSIDFDFLTDLCQAKYMNLLKRYDSYAQNRIVELGNYQHIPSLAEKEWHEFRISKLFSISRPASRRKDDYQEGEIPFVASGKLNNGVIKLCTPLPDEKLDTGNCITVSPVEGSTFYQPINFLGRGGGGSSIIILRGEQLNLYRGLFIVLALQKTCSKYIYGRMGNNDSIMRARILLPVNNSNEPDYEYMEQYVKNLMLLKYKKYLSHIEKTSTL